MSQEGTQTHPASRRPSWRVLAMMGLLVLFVLVPFLFWHGTWFGRPLTEKEIGQYLLDAKRPRKIQHALMQISERILRGDSSVHRWYPQVLTLATHPQLEVRALVAWVMGQDNQSAAFHEALIHLLQDMEPIVRRNAALSLVRFGDTRGRPQLLAMLQPYRLAAGQTGVLKHRLKLGNVVNPGTLLARIQLENHQEFEVRSPLTGELEAWLVADGRPVQAGDKILLLAPASEQVWEALRALYLVGLPEDLPLIERFAQGVPGMPEKIRQQARLTAQAIRQRTS